MQLVNYLKYIAQKEYMNKKSIVNLLYMYEAAL